MPVITFWGEHGMMSFRTAALPLSVVAMLVAGCSSMAPDYVRPALPVPAQYDAAAPAPVPAALAGWRTFFSDPQLQALIEQALRNNRDVRIAVLRVEQARATYGIQRADLFPAIGAQAGLDRSRVPGDLNLTQQPVIASQYQVGLGLASWELDFWGRVRSLRDAALEEYLASDAMQRAATVTLIAQVAQSWLDLRELDQRIALAQRTLATRQESYRIFSRRVEVGSTSRLNLTQVETLLIQAQSLTVQLQQERDSKRHALQLLIGATPDLPAPSLSADAALPDTPLPPVPAGLPSALLEQRPDIVAAEHQLKAANANIGAARAAFFPRIALTGSIGTASAELSGLFGSGSRAWIFSPNIALPLFDGGRRRDNLSLAEARRDSAVAAYEKTIQGAFRDVADALSARLWLTRQLEIAGNALRVQRERARLSQLRYDNGAAPFLDVLDAQRDLLIAEQQLVQVRRAVLSSNVSLYTALGGDGGHAATHPLPTPGNPS